MLKQDIFHLINDQKLKFLVIYHYTALIHCTITTATTTTVTTATTTNVTTATTTTVTT